MDPLLDPLSFVLPPTLPVRWCLRNGRGPNFGELVVELFLAIPCSDEAPEAPGLRCRRPNTCQSSYDYNSRGQRCILWAPTHLLSGMAGTIGPRCSLKAGLAAHTDAAEVMEPALHLCHQDLSFCHGVF